MTVDGIHVSLPDLESGKMSQSSCLNGGDPSRQSLIFFAGGDVS